METEWKLYRTGKKFTALPQLYLHLRQWYLQFRMRKEKGKEEYLYSTIYTMHSPKALRHGSHCFTCKLHYVCLSYVSVHQTAPPLTEVRDIQLQLTTHRSTPKGWKAELACLVDPRKWSPVSYRSLAGQGKFAGQRSTFYRCATQQTKKMIIADGF